MYIIRCFPSSYALNFVDLHWALNYQQMKHAKTELLSRLTIDRLKTQGKLVALVLLDEKARHLQYTLPAELPEVSNRSNTPGGDIGFIDSLGT